MPRLGFGSMVTACFLMALGLASASQAEDGAPSFIDCGGGCGVGTQTASDIFLNVLPGGISVITVAHLAPSPEEAFARGRPINCRPAEFRVDMLRIGAKEVEVELGERQKLEPGQSARIVHSMDPRNDTGAAASDMDQMAFRIRAKRASPRCELVASGAFFEDASSLKSVPFSLLVDDGVKPSHPRKR